MATILRAHGAATDNRTPDDWVFPSRAGTPLGHRNAQRRALAGAAKRAGLENGDWPRCGFTICGIRSQVTLIVDLGLDVAQVSRPLRHARVSITLDVYTHLLDDARHSEEPLSRTQASAFAALLEPPPIDESAGGEVVILPTRRERSSLPARERAALHWGNLTGT